MSLNISLLVIVTVLGCALGCSKQCKQSGSDTSPSFGENQAIVEIVKLMNDACKKGDSESTALCNHTINFPSSTFTDQSLNISFIYSDIVLDDKDHRVDQDSNGANVVISYSYENLSVTVQNTDLEVVMTVPENHFEVSFAVKIQINQDIDPEKNCFFEWKQIKIDKFTPIFNTTPIDEDNEIVKSFKRENLEKILNSERVKNYLNTELSICNKESFLHEITGAFILVLALKGLGSVLGKAIDNIFCS